MRKQSRITFAELDKPMLTWYSFKWFIIWSGRILTLGLAVIVAITALLASSKKSDQS